MTEVTSAACEEHSVIPCDCTAELHGLTEVHAEAGSGSGLEPGSCPCGVSAEL